MVYLLSSSPKTIEEFLIANKIDFQLIDKQRFKTFIDSYIPETGDLGISYDFGLIVPKSLLDKLLLLNIHFSLLPKYRGAVPVEAAIIKGETKTGITIQRMGEKMDSGDILLTREVEIDSKWTAGELQAYMDSLLPELLDVLLKMNADAFKFEPQHGEPTFCYESLLKKENTELRLSNLTAAGFINKVRAFNPEPYAWMNFKKVSGQISKANIIRAEQFTEDIEFDSFMFLKKRGLLLRCSDGVVLVTELVVSGQKPLRNGDIVALKGQYEVLV